MSSELIENFKQVTGADDDTALSFLSACNNNLDMAVSMYMDRTNSSNECRSPIPQRTEQLVPNEPIIRRHRSIDFRPRVRAFVRPDSDEDESVPEADASNHASRRQTGPSVARNFRRVYFDTSHTTPNSTSEPANSGEPSTTNGCTLSGRKRGLLRQLFQPPKEVLFQGSFQNAISYAQSNNSWLLCSVHDEACFDSHILNRDVWKDPRIYQMLKRSFVFVQLPLDRADCVAYRSRYSYVQSASHFAIHDPNNGELKRMWMHLKDPDSVYEVLSDFLRHSPTPQSTSAGSSVAFQPGQRRPLTDESQADSGDNVNPAQHRLDRPLKRLRLDPKDGTATRLTQVRSVHDLSEEEQLELAIRASEREQQPSSSHDATVNPESQTQATPILVSDDDSESVLSTDSDLQADCIIVDPPTRTSTAMITGRRPLRPTESCHSAPSVIDLPVPGPGESALELVVRFPSGTRECLRLPTTLKLTVLLSYFESRGFPASLYEIVHLHPRISLSSLSPSTRIGEIGLAQKDTVFIQER